MGMFDRIRNFFNRSGTITNNGIPDEQGIIWRTANNLWQLSYALDVVSNILSVFFVNTNWKTYSSNGLVKGEEWFRFNYSMNNKESASEFYNKLANKLIKERKALIIETSKGEFFIADSYNFENNKELYMKDNTFTNVQIGDIRFNRTFKENRNCIYIKSPQNDNVEKIFEQMARDYEDLKNLVRKGADKALGTKYALELNSQAKNKYDKEYLDSMQKTFLPLMEKSNAVFVTYKGEVLTDLTERQRGSEVQQVLEAVENNIKINDEILTNVGSAFGIPNKVMTADYTADNKDVFAMAITMFAKPYLKLLSEKFTLYVLNKEDIIKGARIEANLDAIKYVDLLSVSTAMDKLIGSGAYTINEVRAKVDDDPTLDVDGDVRFITKNYAVMSEYTKGGNSNEV